MDTNMVQLGVPLVGNASVPGAAVPAAGRTLPSLQQPVAAGEVAQKNTLQNTNADESGYNTEAADATRRQNVEQAAEMMVSDIYAVGDMKFAIYKDSTGQFITRFTSLRDGAVTYIPEQDMMFYMESRGARRRALLQLDV